MALVDKDDIQVHLPVEKFNIDDMPDSLNIAILDVERIVKGRLSGVFAPATLADWSTPDDTPEYIRAIGGRLAAALLYRLRLAEDYPEDTEYAQTKYQEGMLMLEMVASGSVVLPEVTEVISTGAHLTLGNFNILPDPKFAMDSEF